MEHTEKELKFIGCGISDDFIMEKIRSHTKEGIAIILQPVNVGCNQDAAYNMFEADFNLQKAAPEMYKACKKMIAVLNHYGSDQPEPEFSEMKQVLAKVEGG